MSNTILDQNLGSQGFGGMQADIRPNSERARAAIMMIYIMIVLDIVFLAVSSMQQSLLNADSYDDIQRNAMVIIGVVFFYLTGFIIAAVMFIRWFRRAYYNLHSIDPSYLSYTEGWAAGAWFVPILNFFWPFKIMKEITAETGNHVRRITGESYESPFQLIGWWWAMWIGERVFSLIGNFSNDPDFSLFVTVGAYTLNIIAGILVVIIIKKISVMEQVLYDNRERAGLQHAPVYGSSY